MAYLGLDFRRDRRQSPQDLGQSVVVRGDKAVLGREAALDGDDNGGELGCDVVEEIVEDDALKSLMLYKASMAMGPVVVSNLLGGKPKAWGVESAKNAYAKLGGDDNAYSSFLL
ncbi:hypothetical protein CASFOL_032577 [Castilleja foliolosa]|uniref:Uncharacterized protein n=1 Tax=Castilleja foliolosa TaxID=1961234 RepID=A0ABD3C2Z5_9LAMI